MEHCFGYELRELRKRKGIGSRELSIKVGKAASYVSQVEKGTIVTPSFDIAKLLLKELSIDSVSMKKILSKYYLFGELNEGIVIARRKPFTDLELKNQPDASTVEKERIQYIVDMYNKEADELKEINKRIYQVLSMFIEKDITRASHVIKNISTLVLTSNKEAFNIFCKLHSIDYLSMSEKRRNAILGAIDANYDV